jgi:hypothetical protein
MVDKHSKARELAGYSFLVVFANDYTIDENELHFMEKLALKDNQIDEEEKKVLRNIFSRVSDEDLTAKVLEEITTFRKKYDI